MKITEPTYLPARKAKILRQTVRVQRGRDHSYYISERPRKIVTPLESAKYSWVRHFGRMVRDIKRVGPCVYMNAKWLADSDPAGLTFPRDYLGWAYSGKLIEFVGDGSFRPQTPRLFRGTNQGIFRVTTPTASVWRDSAEALTNSVWKTLTPNTLDWDNNYFWDPTSNPSRLTFRVSGVYQLTATVRFSAVTGSQRMVRFKINGTDHRLVTRFPQPSAVAIDVPISLTWYFSATDYVELACNANSTGVTGQAIQFSVMALTPESIL